MTRAYRPLAAYLLLCVALAAALYLGVDAKRDITRISKTVVKREEVGQLRGPRGFRGPVGPRGARGPRGLVGPMGRVGFRGPRGTQGPVSVRIPRARPVPRAQPPKAPPPRPPVRVPVRPKPLVPLTQLPPGQGGTPPGQGGTPPGQTKPGRKCPPRNPRCP